MAERTSHRFRLLLLSDICSFAMIVAVAIPPRQFMWPLALILATTSGLAARFAQHLHEPLSGRQMRARAALALVGYPAIIVEIIWAAVVSQHPAVWALASVAIPLLCVFGYASVRAKLGLEPHISGYT